MATSILLKFLTLGLEISRTIGSVEVSAPATTPQTGNEVHREPRLQAHTICMGEDFLKSSVQFQTFGIPL